MSDPAEPRRAAPQHDLPGWSCPAIDRVATMLREHVPEPDRTRGLILLETVRVAHVQLRHAASGRSPERVAAEVARLEAVIERLYPQDPAALSAYPREEG